MEDTSGCGLTALKGEIIHVRKSQKNCLRPWRKRGPHNCISNVLTHMSRKPYPCDLGDTALQLHVATYGMTRWQIFFLQLAEGQDEEGEREGGREWVVVDH
mmetsp:Transcript_111135/g.192761  ORF Transcript_111135/g.192761 Transcript_111135/m.192761 type:complete len:101 (-) Transcript_111135:22-324(-)